MLKTIGRLQGVTILSKEAQKKIYGKGNCGVKIGGVWYQIAGSQIGNSGTMDDALAIFNGDAVGTVNGEPISGTATNWCCDSCPWN